MLYWTNKISMDAQTGSEPPTTQPKMAPVVANETMAAMHRQKEMALKNARTSPAMTV
jgi:hypothetical protein